MGYRGRTKVETKKCCRCVSSECHWLGSINGTIVRGEGQIDHVFTVRPQQPKFDLFQVSLVLLESCLVGAEQAMALLTNGAQNLGSYYCLIRRRFKRRRKKRSERKGNPRSSSCIQRVMLSCLLVDLVMFSNWQAVVELN